MKKTLLVIGIIAVILAFLSLAYSGLNLFMYYKTLDGSSSLYSRLHNGSIVFLIIGIILAVTGAACFIVRKKV